MRRPEDATNDGEVGFHDLDQKPAAIDQHVRCAMIRRRVAVNYLQPRDQPECQQHRQRAEHQEQWGGFAGERKPECRQRENEAGKIGHVVGSSAAGASKGLNHSA